MGLLDPDGNPFQVDERFDVRPTVGVPVIVDSVRNTAPAGARESISASHPDNSAVASPASPASPAPVRPRRTCAFARWSLTPPFSKELKTKFSTFNARSETVTEKASFRHAVPAQRTVLIADGYYEWLTDASGAKQPFYIHNGDISGVEPILFAGLYSWWRDQTTREWVLTATMLTRAAVGPVSSIHDRTPMMLHAGDLDEWLDPRIVGNQAFIDDFSTRSIALGESLRFHEVAPLRGASSSDWVQPVAQA